MAEEFKVLVIGETGTGKSTLCNKLLGRKHFNAIQGWSANTLTAESASRKIGNVTLTVIDTPDLENSGITLETDQREVEYGKWKTLTDGSLYAVLLVVRHDVDFDENRYRMYHKLRRVLQEKMTDNLILAFTRVESLENDIEAEIETADPRLQEVFVECQGRYILFSEKEDTDASEAEVQKLIHFIRKIKSKRETNVTRSVALENADMEHEDYSSRATNERRPILSTPQSRDPLYKCLQSARKLSTWFFFIIIILLIVVLIKVST